MCEGSTFCPEESTVLAITRDRTSTIAGTIKNTLADDPDPAYPTIEALLFSLYLDYLIEPETHTSGSSPEGKKSSRVPCAPCRLASRQVSSSSRADNSYLLSCRSTVSSCTINLDPSNEYTYTLITPRLCQLPIPLSKASRRSAGRDKFVFQKFACQRFF